MHVEKVMTKILFIGLGSIGQRHLRILIKLLGRKKYEFYSYKSSLKNIVINDKLKTKKVKSLTDFYKIKSIDLGEITKHKFDIVYITNPAHLHIHFAIKFAKFGANIFIEKPLSSNLKKIALLSKIAKKNKIKICVGYQFRFHPGVQYIKKKIKNNKLGKIVSGKFHFGEYLPLMQKFKHYTKTNMARRSEGGGAILSLSHEIDLVRYLIGEPKILSKSKKKLSKLKINVEDSLIAKLRYKKNLVIDLEVNFLDNPPKHFIHLNFEYGNIFCDFIKKNIIYVDNNRKIKKKIILKNFKRNTMFIDQSKNFINSIKHNKKNLSDLKEGIKTLKLCLLLKKD
jgi:predicted dehydrogenase